MKQINVEIGGTYTAKVSGRIVPVTVLRVIESFRYIGSRLPDCKYRTSIKYVCRNEATGREITCSAARLRRRVQPS